MKRIVILPFLMFYLLTTIGMSASMHFCGGELEAFEVNTVVKNDCCCDTDDEEQSDCCSNKQIAIQAVDLHQQVNLTSLPNLIPSVSYSLIPDVYKDYFSFSNYSSISTFSHAPPPLARNNPLFISLCTLLI